MNSNQQAILHFLASQDNEAPLSAIRKLPGLSHSQLLNHHLGQLQKRNLVEVDTVNKIVRRVIPLDSPEASILAIPVYGSATAGPTRIFADDKITGYLRLTRGVLNSSASKHVGSLAALAVDGESMNKATIDNKQIKNGDFVLVDTKDQTLEDKKYVVAVLDGMPAVKQFVYGPNREYGMLVSHSTKNFAPILISEDDNFLVAGKVLQVIEKPPMSPVH